MRESHHRPFGNYKNIVILEESSLNYFEVLTPNWYFQRNITIEGAETSEYHSTSEYSHESEGNYIGF